MSALRNAGLIAAGLVVPLAVGLLVVGPSPPHGRNSHSPTRVGHKALYQLLDELGYRVRRFERGLERPPPSPSVLLAIEPGGLLFREGGRYAAGLRRWLEAGNAALVTLGPDADHGAEIDDAGAMFSRTTQDAIDLAREVERRAAGRGEAPKPRRGDSVEKQSPLIDTTTPGDPWPSQNLAAFVGLPLVPDRLETRLASEPCALEGPLASAIGPAAKVVATRPRTWSSAPDGAEIIATACGAPVLLEVVVGEGRLWLLSEPRLLQNGRVASGEHALLAVRIVERLGAHVGSDVVYFEEFSHGSREASNPFSLAFVTSARWPMLQLMFVALVAIGAYAGRRRSVVPMPRASRRRRQEVIDAMATLYARSGDVAGAAAHLELSSRHRLARTLGAKEALTERLARRTSMSASSVAAILDASQVDSDEALIRYADRLRELRLSVESKR